MIGYGLMWARLDVTSDNDAFVGAGTIVNADSFTLDATTEHILDGTAVGGSGGVVDISQGEIDVTLSDFTDATIEGNAEIYVDGDIEVRSEMTIEAANVPDRAAVGIPRSSPHPV